MNGGKGLALSILVHTCRQFKVLQSAGCHFYRLGFGIWRPQQLHLVNSFLGRIGNGCRCDQQLAYPRLPGCLCDPDHTDTRIPSQVDGCSAHGQLPVQCELQLLPINGDVTIALTLLAGWYTR